ncbi:RING-H2 finger protein ATL78-like [Senna tora]|uniref:RING-type E3 ubiquitin transferase n=1 Tax=Senna tora TaxID=362788 RepID=A0A835C9L3_9FABA|nr:RING-H2 finger protein ATL78-like [Senna tora]
MVLSVLLCALICSLGLNSIIRCALRCSNITSSSTSNPPSLVPHRPAAANTGVKKKALKTFPTITYDQKLPGLDDTECAICLCDFSNGDRLRILPKCNHGFHVRCIDKWLNSHSSCPKCRHCLIHTCEKIVGCASSGGITTTSQAQGGSSQVETMVRIIAPLEPEDPPILVLSGYASNPYEAVHTERESPKPSLRLLWRLAWLFFIAFLLFPIPLSTSR